jgi:ribosomal protein S18 acetylase RimI-like enzyme
MDDYDFSWRGEFANGELNRLHAEAFSHQVLDVDWWRQVKLHSLGWVTARDGAKLIGFVNVPWDGGSHAFILDIIVKASVQRQGIGTRLVAIAASEAGSAGCEHLHVDFSDELCPFYFDKCGFRPTSAGLLVLIERSESAG